MNRKSRYVVNWWLLGVLVLTSLMPRPVGAQTSQIMPIGEPTTFLPLVQKPGGGNTGSEAAWPMAGAILKEHPGPLILVSAVHYL